MFCMDERAAVSTFCNLLSSAERAEMFELLAEYSTRVEKLAHLITRAEEYKLVLELSKRNLEDAHQKLLYSAGRSIALGVCLGVLCAVIGECLTVAY